jgi:hypothetical protein
LSKKYDEIDRNKNLHITNFSWFKIIDIAKIIQSFIPCNIIPAKKKDSVQLNKKNEPDPYVLEFWEPKIEIQEGINKIINIK